MKQVNIENENESQVNLKKFIMSFSVRKTAVRRRIRRITACMANPYVFRITQLFFLVGEVIWPQSTEPKRQNSDCSEIIFAEKRIRE